MNIFLNGYFHENLGDDLFFHIITRRYPNHQFHMLAHGDHASAYRGVPNAKIHPQCKLLRGADKVLSKLSPKLSFGSLYGRTKDLSVLIGGSMFQEMQDDGSDLKRLALMPENHKKLYIMGINYGPAHTQAYEDACRKYLASATDVCFRDQTSYNRFRDLPNTRVGNDIAFGIRRICPTPVEKENTCIIAPIDFGKKPALVAYKQAYLEFLKARLLEQQAQGRQVILMSFCKWEGDEDAIRELLDLCSPEVKAQVTTLCYNGQNWQELCQCIGSAAYMIATRFHSMVLALAYGVPTLAISYSNKTRQLLQDMDRGECAIMPEELADLPAEKLTPVTGIDIDYWQSQADVHFEKLDELLNP